MSEYAAAVRELLEQSLECRRCGAINTPALRSIRVDVNGVACCDNCGRGGPYQSFEPKKETRT